ncbi:hypothetical protein [Kibdelosporangium aridum]|nr:hypothetical protein [Kibdelosporangium aridum]
MLKVTGASMVAAVTRSPAISKLMKHAFRTVLPDLSDLDPFHLLERHGIRAAAECYARYAGADPADVPIVFDRYVGGLYGGPDPGRGMPLGEVADNPANGVIVIAADRKSKW